MALAEQKQVEQKQQYLRLGDRFPNFTCETTAGKGRFYDMIGNSWGILFSHPADFTPVCTTELASVASLQQEFDSRGVRLFGLSCNSLEDHEKWVADIEKNLNQKIIFPLIADEDRSIAFMLGMLDPEFKDAKGLPMTVRNVFIIAPDKKIALMLIYPPSTGRNFSEVLRCVDSLQLKTQGIATPANWKKGDNIVILPNVSKEEQEKRFPKMEAVVPYLRMSPMPVDEMEDEKKLLID